MIIIKSPDQIEGIRRSSQLAAQTLKHTAAFIKPGISTQKLNDLAHRFILDHQAIPAPFNYNGYPKSICTSVNNVVCHGIPSSKQILQKGDILNIDITTILNGFYGDVSATYPVGQISSQAQKLLKVTQDSLSLAAKAVKPGRLLNEAIGKTIEDYVTPFGYAPVKLLGGHGVGVRFHEDPFVFHFYYPKDKTILKPGMIFTIEPMINASPSSEVTIDRQDGWTVRTLDGALSCQFEHTILVTDSGHQILTQL
ncbi:type I methionyl aminopeptidase [Candidatus Shapirobacteria bacterium RBG_13_44_7]|uniref:Methionine aminopeptidase n=1 Tax=Candidatus Shapirobacteria bacterium RBG_13_44_7 TaxID=1802149 RepID=A0A1F7SIM5_9BACT|nr:MAG: type I methionyl aminopeptidase [Candidatus Shapirobacteria bacterium RBG_13_44_7]